MTSRRLLFHFVLKKKLRGNRTTFIIPKWTKWKNASAENIIRTFDEREKKDPGGTTTKHE
jgi:hypothetical protein